MNLKAITSSLFFAALVVSRAGAQFEVGFLPSLDEIEAVEQAGGKEQPKQPDKQKKTPEQKLTEPPDIDPFAQTPMGAEFATGFNPHMMGDFPSVFVRKNITVFATQTIIQTCNCGVPQLIPTSTTVKAVPVSRPVLIATSVTGAFKIADNESPRPQDRVFITYNYFDSLRGPAVNAMSQNLTTISPNGNGTRTIVNTFIPAAPQVNTNLHREIAGFEKTFLDGTASIEVRVPFSEQYATNIDGFATGNIGDVTVIGKYAFYLDRNTGNVMSGGIGVTAPSGPRIDTVDGNLNCVLLQPFIGYIWNSDQFFIHAFHAIVVPTDAQNVTLLFNDVGLNYWIYRPRQGSNQGQSAGQNQDRILRSVVGLVEAHVTTPLNHHDINGTVYVPNMVIMTAGVHLGLYRNATLSLGIAAPITSPRIFGFEPFVQFNRRF